MSSLAIGNVWTDANPQVSSQLLVIDAKQVIRANDAGMQIASKNDILFIGSEMKHTGGRFTRWRWNWLFYNFNYKPVNSLLTDVQYSTYLKIPNNWRKFKSLLKKK